VVPDEHALCPPLDKNTGAPLKWIMLCPGPAATETMYHYRILTVRDNYNLKSHKYVCITVYQPDTKSNPNPNPNPNPTAKQHPNSEHSTKYSRMSYVSR